MKDTIFFALLFVLCMVGFMLFLSVQLLYRAGAHFRLWSWSVSPKQIQAAKDAIALLQTNEGELSSYGRKCLGDAQTTLVQAQDGELSPFLRLEHMETVRRQIVAASRTGDEKLQAAVAAVLNSQLARTS